MKLELDVKREGRKFKVKARSPLGKKSGFFELDPSLHSKIGTIQQAIEEQEHLDKAFIKNLGIQLFQLLFSDIKELFHGCLNSERLDVILNTNDIELSVLPWELCYNEEKDIFLGADSHCSLVRRDQTSAKTFGKIDYPLKVLIIVSSPMDLDEKGEYQPDPDEIIELMAPLKELEKKGMVAVDFLERASVKYIQDQLKTGYHIVHFIGHGSYDSKKGKGYLIIEDKQRNSKKLEGSQVARLFGVNPPQLLILTACESSPLIPFLIKRIPAVMAMQYTVLKDIAHQFIERFYSLLLKGDTATQAVSSAREAVSLEEGITHPSWFTPILYMRSENILNINIDSVPTPPPKTTVERVDMDKDLIGAENFVGRRKNLWSVEKALFEDKLKMVVVTGIGGIGKSALAKKFVNRHRTKFKGVLGKKMVDPHTGVEGILVVLDQFLLQNGEQRFHAVMEEPSLDLKLEVLNNCLKVGYLVVLDNFEVLIEDSHIRGKDIEDFVKGVLFGNHNSKVIITSRYQFTFRDGKGGGLVKNVDLRELSLQYARQLLENQEITDIEMQKEIYKKVGGNPQFLEFFTGLAKTRTSERLLEDLTPVREKIGEWLLNELVGELHEEAVRVLKIFSVFRRPVERGVFDVLGADGDVIDTLVYYSLVKVDKGLDDLGEQYVYYFMHQGVRDYCHSLFSGDEKTTAHAEAAKYYRMLFEKKRADLLDIFELHHHLFESEQYEEAGNLIEGIFESFYMRGFREELIGLLIQTIKTTKGDTKAGGLFNLGKVLDALGNYKEAEECYTQSLELFESLGDEQGIASSLGQLGILQYRQGNYEEAEKYYTQSLELAESLGNKQGIARSLHQLGILLEEQGNYEEAEKYYTQSLELAESLGDKQGIASSLHQLGMLQYRQGNYKEAEKYYTQSLELFKSLGDKQGIASSLHQLGMLQYRQGNYKEAEKYYTQSLELKEGLGDKQGIAQSLHQLGILLEEQGNYEEAEKYYTQSLELLKSLGDKQGIASSLGQLGNLQYRQGNYEEAEKYYTQSLELLKSLGDKQGIASSLGQLGNLQYRQGNYEEAEKYYTQSLELKESLGDKQGIASSLHQLGMLQEDQGNYEEAEKYYTQSLELKESLGDKQGIASSLHQLGMIFEDKESYKEAVEYFINSLAIFLELNSPDAETAIKSLKRVRNTIGGEFDTYWKTITNQEVPDFLEPTYEEQMEDFIHHIMYVVDMNEYEDIERATETLTELLKESTSDEKQLFQFLLDYINRKDISQKIKELPEPFKSILEEYF